MPQGFDDIPVGWFVDHAGERRSAIKFRGDTHDPLPHAKGVWEVCLQHVTGGKYTRGEGHDFYEALADAVANVKQQWGTWTDAYRKNTVAGGD